MECAAKSNIRNNRGDWNHFEIIQTIPQQHTGKHEIKKLQKRATLSTAHTLGKVLM